MASRLARAFRYLYDLVVQYALKFGVVGLVGYFIDLSISNALWYGALGEDNFFHSTIGAKVVSVSVATLATWFGNRYWTFRDSRRDNFMLELLEFAVIAVLGLGISIGCLWVSEYVFGFTSILSRNIAGNLVGLILATAFRFLLYRYWVYGEHRSDSKASRDRREAERLASEQNA